MRGLLSTVAIGLSLVASRSAATVDGLTIHSPQPLQQHILEMMLGARPDQVLTT